MIRLRYWLHGALQAEVIKGDGVAFYEQCRKNHLRVYSLKERQGRKTMAIAYGDYGKLPRISKKLHVRCKAVKRYGLPFYLAPYKKRYGFFAGALLFLLLVVSFGQRIWRIEVKGNTLVSTEAILAAAQDVGISFGKPPASDDLSTMAQKTLLQLPKLASLSYNLNGARMEIDVTERQMPAKAPERSHPGNLVADTDGVLVSGQIRCGVPTLQVGQPFVKGDVLVSAYVVGKHIRQSVCAEADLFARVERTYSVDLPAGGIMLHETGKKTHGLMLSFFDQTREFWQTQPPYTEFRRSEKTRRLSVGTTELPISFCLITASELSRDRVARTKSARLAEGVWRLNQTIRKALGEKGKLEGIVWHTETTEERLRVVASTTMILPVGVFEPVEAVFERLPEE